MVVRAQTQGNCAGVALNCSRLVFVFIQAVAFFADRSPARILVHQNVAFSWIST